MRFQRANALLESFYWYSVPLGLDHCPPWRGRAEDVGRLGRIVPLVEAQAEGTPQSLFKISKLMGNSPEICRRHYAALVSEEMTDTVEFPVAADGKAKADDHQAVPA
jgi:hypothetical protein